MYVVVPYCKYGKDPNEKSIAEIMRGHHFPIISL